MTQQKCSVFGSASFCRAAISRRRRSSTLATTSGLSATKAIRSPGSRFGQRDQARDLVFGQELGDGGLDAVLRDEQIGQALRAELLGQRRQVVDLLAGERRAAGIANQLDLPAAAKCALEDGELRVLAGRARRPSVPARSAGRACPSRSGPSPHRRSGA